MRKIDIRIHDTAIINNMDSIEIDSHSIIDAFVYLSTSAKIGKFVHIAPHVSIIGGNTSMLVCEDFTAIASGSRMVCGSDNYKNSLLGPQMHQRFRTTKISTITLRKYSGVGVNAVVMPGIEMAEGSVLGANSLLTNNTAPWGIYVGSPAKWVGQREKESIIKNAAELLKIAKYKEDSIIVHKFEKEELPEYAHLKIDSVGAVGNIGFALNSLYFMRGRCRSVYLDINDGKKELFEHDFNMYDEILNQELTDQYKIVRCWGNGLFDYDADILKDIRITVAGYLDFKINANYFVENNNIGSDTLGVHVRMNDFNSWHGVSWGVVTIEDYCKQIDNVLAQNNIKNIFIASDNYESLEYLKNKYSSLVVFNKLVRRADKEELSGDIDFLRAEAIKRFANKEDIETPFLDMLTLSKCGHIIGRKHSNFFVAAIMLGKMPFENIHNLGT